MGKTEKDARIARPARRRPSPWRGSARSAEPASVPRRNAAHFPRDERGLDTRATPVHTLVRRTAVMGLLTREEERELTDEARNGNEEERQKAREVLVVRNLRLVMKWADKYRGAGLPFDDLVQEGTIGLLRAIESYDPNKGVKLGTYASWWIRQAMQRAVSQKSRTVRLPVYLRDVAFKAKRASEELSHILGREPSTEEIAELLDLDTEELRRAVSAESSSEPASLEAPALARDGSTGAVTLGHFTADPSEDAEREELDKEGRNAALRSLLQNILSDEERRVIERRYGLVDDRPPATLTQTAKELGLGRKAVAKTQRAAENKLHRSPLLAPYATGRPS